MFFLSDGGGRAMTGVDDCLGREGEDFFANPIEENLSTAPRQIPTADSIGKKHIPSEELPARGKVQADAARAVAGNV